MNIECKFRDPNKSHKRSGLVHTYGPAYGARPFYPEYFYCTHCGENTNCDSTDNGWKYVPLCHIDKSGAFHCPDCGFKVRTHPKPYNVARGLKRKAERRLKRLSRGR